MGEIGVWDNCVESFAVSASPHEILALVQLHLGGWLSTLRVQTATDSIVVSWDDTRYGPRKAVMEFNLHPEESDLRVDAVCLDPDRCARAFCYVVRAMKNRWGIDSQQAALPGSGSGSEPRDIEAKAEPVAGPVVEQKKGSGHFEHPDPERRKAIVKAFYEAKERGEIINIDNWAKNKYNICAKTLRAYRQEFPE